METLCTVSGNLKSIDDGYIDVGYINKADEIEEHSELVTSHVSDKFLPGILIGYITEVELDANNLTKSAKCIPVVDFSNLQEVLVILDLKADYQTDSENKNLYDGITSTEDDKDAVTTEALDTENGDDTSEATEEDGEASANNGEDFSDDEGDSGDTGGNEGEE
jgi:rod shape-determining protein MreC